jgi:hypothetical protein
MIDSPTIYSTYNARMLSPEEIARTFVINDAYRKLLRVEHSILRGPRGTGKTTLLKMLTPRALKEWGDREKYNVPPRLPFVAVYVPSDVVWVEQLQQLKHIPAVGEILSKAAVTCNVLHALLGTFKEVINLYFNEGLNSEVNHPLCTRLAQALRLEAFPSLDGLRVELDLRLRDLQSIASKIKQHPTNQPELPDFCYDDYFAQTRLLCSIFEEVVRSGRNELWAMCFDELEICPEWLLVDLLKKLRSTDQRFLFKISLSPTQGISQEKTLTGGPSSGNDYTDIPLWYPTQREGKKFCEDMMKKFLRLKFDADTSPRDLFGLSPFTEDTSYEPGSPFWRLLSKHERYDPSLSVLLRSKGIDLSHPDMVTTEDKDQVLRKLKPILVLRDAFRNPGKPGLRSRKRPGLYYGYDAIAAISDGNPRWLIGLLNDLLLDVAVPIKVPPSKQEVILTAAGQRFNALINSLPQPAAKTGNQVLRLKDLLRRVSRFFFQRVVTDDINLDPSNCFTVDAHTNEELLGLLQKAVDLGAVVLVDEAPTGKVPTSLRGSTLRLSFMLATVYRQPLRVMGSIALSRCLDMTSNTSPTITWQLPLLEK